MNDTSGLTKPLPESKRCDRKQDCKNNEDEKNCRSNYRIMISYFSFIRAAIY